MPLAAVIIDLFYVAHDPHVLSLGDDLLVVVSWWSCSWRSVQGDVGLTQVFTSVFTQDEVHTLGILLTPGMEHHSFIKFNQF